ncbi:hypothetical protein [Comamonas sp. 4034]|uniref:hypothetical protein n=1 Tax=Comamonas sp. 4034 TaxID=3156455 RepID=UPI003D253156
MKEQMNIQGVPPVRAKVSDARVAELSRLLGGMLAAGDLVDELKKAQSEHPALPGMTLSIAVAEKHLAQLQMKNSRLVLILACSAGLEVERVATSIEIRDDGELDLVSVSGQQAQREGT